MSYGINPATGRCRRCGRAQVAMSTNGRGALYPHSAWFRPYVAGYYAFTALGKDLSREEVEERIDELLAVGQPWLSEAAT